MLNELDERINKALIFLSNAKDCTATAYELEPERESFSNINIVKFLIELDLAVPVQTLNLSPDICRISKKGIDIFKSGGWLQHLELEKIKSDKSNRKLGYDLRISRIKANTYVPVMILGTFGGIYSTIKVFLLILGLSNPEQTQATNSQKKLNKSNKITNMAIQKYSDHYHPDSLKTFYLSNSDQLSKGQKK